MIYSTGMLLEKYGYYSNAYNKIQRECINGNLIRLRRGLYEDDPSVAPYLCSGYIYGPSYISFDYVLSLSGLIPEYTPTICCASYRKNKVKQYNTRIGSFIYRDVPPQVFPVATIAVLEKGYSYIIASPEKALCDKLYSVSPVYSDLSFEEMLFRDLRVDINGLINLDMNLIKAIAPLYHCSNTHYLLRYCSRQVATYE